MALFDNVQPIQTKAAPAAGKADAPAKSKSAKAIAWEKARDTILAYIADEKKRTKFQQTFLKQQKSSVHLTLVFRLVVDSLKKNTQHTSKNLCSCSA